MNISKLRKLKKWILEEPRRYNQNTWMDYGDVSVKVQQPPCGTVACLAGGACLMEGYKPDGRYTVINPKTKMEEYIECAARRILGLSVLRSHNLFGGDAIGWSLKARKAFRDAYTLEGRAKAAAMELDRLIRIAQRKS